MNAPISLHDPKHRAPWIQVELLALLATRAPSDPAKLPTYELLVAKLREASDLMDRGKYAVALEMLLIFLGMALGTGFITTEEAFTIAYRRPEGPDHGGSR